MTTWSRHYHFASDRNREPERERRNIWFAANDDDQAQSPGETPQLPEHEERLPAEPQGIEGISGKIRSRLDRVRPLVATAASNSPFILQELLQHIHDPELEAQIQTYLQQVEKKGGTPPPLPEIRKRIEEYLEDPQAAAIITLEFEQQLQRYRDCERQLHTVNTAALQELDARLSLEGRRSLKENEWTLKELRAMARHIGLSYSREWSAADNRRIGADASFEQNCLLETLHNKLEAARAVTVLGQHTLGKEVDAGTLSTAVNEFTKQVHHARKYLDLLVEAQARQLNEAYEKKLLPWQEQYAKNPDRVHTELGVSGAALKHALIETGAPIKRALRLAGGEGEANLPKVSDEQFTQHAYALLKELHQSRWLLTARNSEEVEAHLVGTEKLNQDEARTWAKRNAARVRRAAQRLRLDTALCEQLNQMQPESERDIASAMENCAALCERLRDGETEFEDEEQLYDHFSTSAIAKRETLLSVIENPSLQAQLAADMQPGLVNLQHKAAEAKRLQQDLSTAERDLFPGGKLHSALDHEVCRAPNVEKLLQHRIEDVRVRLQVSEGIKGPRAAQYLRSCAADIRRLRYCADKLSELASGATVVEASPEQFKDIAGTDEAVGFYNNADQKIYINTGKVNTQQGRDTVVHHEHGHAIVDLLMRRSGVLPGLLIGTHALLQEEVPESGGQSYEDLLMELSQQWFTEQQRAAFEQQELIKIGEDELEREAIARDRADARIRELLMDELMNRHASWVHSGKPADKLSSAEQKLFALLDRGKTPGKAAGNPNLAAPTGAYLTEVDEGETGDGTPKERPPDSSQEIVDDPTQHFIEINRHLNHVRQFLKTHTELKGQEVYREWEEWLNNREQLFREYELRFKEQEGNEQEQAGVRAYIKQIRDDAEKHAGMIGNYEKAELDISNVPATGRGGLPGLLGNVQFLCIYDLYNMVKDAGEDIHRLWKRRGERARSVVGQALTEWIPEWIDSPLYLGKLKHEFKRRSDQSEIEEVKQWKEALENRDSFLLQDMLGSTRNKDELRAIIELLVDRGRLDWNDVAFWKNLSSISNYNNAMPYEACKNNDLLRDQWLQKIITDIWEDKEHYNTWRRTNDGNIKSKKDAWTPKVDQFANIDGGMKGRLESMLRTYVEATEAGRDIPEEVDPHLYEEVLHYAIRLGKMSMEDKFFYLIQGVRYGLLSIDRLRVLAGDGGGVLMIFPYIDYFYQKNNSLPEIVALGKKLDEGREGEDRFTPGLRTTMFVRTELMKEQAAKERLRKAISKRGEEIDHDDIPYFMTDIDWSGVEEWLGVMSGTRQKLSKPALMNIYPGFNMKFKTAAVLASLHKNKRSKFRLSTADVAELVQRLVAYLHADNILTRNGFTGANRPFISEMEYDQQPVVSGAERTTRQYRTSMNGFAQQVFATFANEQFWKEINTKLGAQEGEEVTRERYVGNAVDSNGPKIVENCGKATAHIATRMQRVITQDPQNVERFIDLLASYGDKFLADAKTCGVGERIDQYLHIVGNDPRMSTAMATAL